MIKNLLPGIIIVLELGFLFAGIAFKDSLNIFF